MPDSETDRRESNALEHDSPACMTAGSHPAGPPAHLARRAERISPPKLPEGRDLGE